MSDTNWRKVYIGNSVKNGRGVFASRNIKKDEIIFKASGRVIQDDKYYAYFNTFKRALGVGYCKWITPTRKNPLYYLNHSCNPNAGIVGKSTIVATKHIKAREQITLDYSTTEENPYWAMKCGCQSKNCRKIVRCIQSLSRKRVKKYSPYINKYFLDSYHKKGRVKEYLKNKFKLDNEKGD